MTFKSLNLPLCSFYSYQCTLRELTLKSLSSYPAFQYYVIFYWAFVVQQSQLRNFLTQLNLKSFLKALCKRISEMLRKKKYNYTKTVTYLKFFDGTSPFPYFMQTERFERACTIYSASSSTFNVMAVLTISLSLRFSGNVLKVDLWYRK